MRITIKKKSKEEREIERKRFSASKSTRIPKKVFVSFFDNNAMARVLDLFMENPNKEIFTGDIVEKASISDKKFQQNAIILEKLGILTYSGIGRAKLYKLNHKNEYVILISKLWHKLNINAIG